MTSSNPSLSHTDTPALESALTDVAEQSFFAMSEPCTAAEALDERGAHAPWLTAGMDFSSTLHRGSVSVTLPVGLARDLAGAFVGGDDEEITAGMLNDATGELCNMLCGLWLTRTRPQEAFRLSSPLVREMDAPDFTRDAGVVRLNGVPVSFSLSGPERV